MCCFVLFCVVLCCFVLFCVVLCCFVLLSAIANWQLKNEDVNIEEADLYVKEIYVDSARMLKRLRTAPQGRAHRIRKRSHHLAITVDDRNAKVENDNEMQKD
jgi:large subunit ribosomal protein L22